MNETQIETQTEIDRPKEELFSAQMQLREILDHTPVVIYRLKLEGQKIIPEVTSEGITRLLGFTVAAGIATPITKGCTWLIRSRARA